jgi:activator of 2-hydroxyglutaryl-CoA dehydratase
MKALGIDVGSTTVKIVGVDERHRFEIGVSVRWKSVGNRLAVFGATRLIGLHSHSGITWEWAKH